MTKKHMPNMVSVMTPFPHFIAPNATLADANDMMEKFNIHHLPVVDEGDIIGMLSMRDMLKAIHLGESLRNQHDILVSDLIHHRPYMVDVSDPLPNVLHAMSDNHIGSVIVLKDGDLAGVFTTNDALRLYAAALEDAFLANPDGDDAA